MAPTKFFLPTVTTEVPFKSGVPSRPGVTIPKWKLMAIDKFKLTSSYEFLDYTIVSQSERLIKHWDDDMTRGMILDFSDIDEPEGDELVNNLESALEKWDDRKVTAELREEVSNLHGKLITTILAECEDWESFFVETKEMFESKDELSELVSPRARPSLNWFALVKDLIDSYMLAIRDRYELVWRYGMTNPDEEKGPRIEYRVLTWAKWADIISSSSVASFFDLVPTPGNVDLELAMSRGNSPFVDYIVASKKYNMSLGYIMESLMFGACAGALEKSLDRYDMLVLQARSYTCRSQKWNEHACPSTFASRILQQSGLMPLTFLLTQERRPEDLKVLERPAEYGTVVPRRSSKSSVLRIGRNPQKIRAIEISDAFFDDFFDPSFEEEDDSRDPPSPSQAASNQPSA